MSHYREEQQQRWQRLVDSTLSGVETNDGKRIKLMYAMRSDIEELHREWLAADGSNSTEICTELHHRALEQKD